MIRFAMLGAAGAALLAAAWLHGADGRAANSAATPLAASEPADPHSITRQLLSGDPQGPARANWTPAAFDPANPLGTIAAPAAAPTTTTLPRAATAASSPTLTQPSYWRTPGPRPAGPIGRTATPLPLGSPLVLSATPAATAAPTPIVLLNVNTATAEELARIPGFDIIRAENVVQFRAVHGPYRELADIKRVFGISDCVFARIAPYLTLSPQSAPALAPVRSATP